MTAYSQRSNEKRDSILVDRVRYQNFLIKSNQTADKLILKVKELEIAMSDLDASDKLNEKYKATIEGIEYQIAKMNEYVKYLKKRITKAWFNGVWQGGVIVGALLYLLILL